jgi:UDP-glucuronate 4-epimerase
VAEWLCSGLQIRQRRFDSDLSLNNMKDKNRILVTGAAGFIGSYTARHYLNLGHEVMGLDNLNSYYDKGLKFSRLEKLKDLSKFRFKEIDLKDIMQLRDIFLTFKPGIVIHLAAQAGVRHSLIDPHSYIDSNIISFHNLLECLKKSTVEKFVFASSSSVYGNSSKVPYSESDDTNNPVSLYAATKKSNEVLAHSFAFNNNIPTIGLRFFTVYGPQGRPDMAYFKFADLISSNKKMTIFNEGKMSRDMTYIDDIIQGLSKAVSFDEFRNEIPFEIFNLGNNSPISTWQLIEHIENYFNKKGNYSFENSSIEVKETWANLNKSKKLLEFSPNTEFAEGMNNFLDWFKLYKGIN